MREKDQRDEDEMRDSLSGQEREAGRPVLCWRDLLQGGLHGEVAEGWSVERAADVIGADRENRR